MPEIEERGEGTRRRCRRSPTNNHWEGVGSRVGSVYSGESLDFGARGEIKCNDVTRPALETHV